MNLSFSELLSKSFRDFKSRKIISILLICFILTFFLLKIVTYYYNDLDNYNHFTNGGFPSRGSY